jgi:hypothetical protein
MRRMEALNVKIALAEAEKRRDPRVSNRAGPPVTDSSAGSSDGDGAGALPGLYPEGV